MYTNRSLFGIARRTAALSFLMVGTATLLQAQQVPSAASDLKAPLLLASESAPTDLATVSSSSSSSSSSDDAATADHFNLAALSGSQPPPRRHYGRPNYSDSHNNADGSSKYTFLAGAGLTAPTGNTHKYQTPSYDFQVGFGRNFNKTAALIFQFDYDHFGLQAKNIADQSSLYFNAASGVGLDGTNHIWSFTLNPTFTLPTEGSLGAYAVFGVGYYHKVTDFTVPGSGVYYDNSYCYYGCQYSANQTFDFYTSNAVGFNGGLGLTYKFSKFSNERFYVEARYVFTDNQQRYGYTLQNASSTTYQGWNFYPANSNRTTYIPIKFGIRF